MQISRLFEIVYILLHRRRVTAKELAERFEVSVRTIYRDIEALSAAGVPVYATQGAGGGIYISPQYVLNKSALTDEEQSQILIALKSLSIPDPARADSLLSRLGTLFDKRSEDWIEVDFSRWGVTPHDQQTLSTLKDAIVLRRVLTFLYFNSYGQRGRRTVSPVKLVYKARSWYLQAFCHDKRAFRTFKLSRMADIAPSGDVFDRDILPSPPPLEAVGEMQRPPVKVLLRFHPKGVWRALDEFDPCQSRFNDDGSLTVQAWLPADEWLYGYLMSFGRMVEILSPDELRLGLMEEMRKIADHHEKPDR